MEDLKQKLRGFAADRDWDQFHSPPNELKYPVDKSKGNIRKYNEI